MAAKEEAGNYDVINGAGAWARKLARAAEYEATRAEREARWALEAQEAEQRAAAKLLAETPEQKAKRLRRRGQGGA